MKKKLKLSITSLLIFAMLVGTFIPTLALTVGGSDSLVKGNTGYTYSGVSFTDQVTGKKHDKYGEIPMLTLRNEGRPVYCIDLGNSASPGMVTGTSIRTTPYWNALSDSTRRGITFATIYGYPNNSFGVSAKAAYAATQIIMWEYQIQYRTIPRNGSSTLQNAQFYNSCVKKYPEVLSAYNQLNAKIDKHQIGPNVPGNITMQWNAGNGRYEASFYDSNEVLADCSIYHSSEIGHEHNGNSVIFFSYAPVNGGVSVRFEKNLPTATAELLLSGAGQQIIYGTLDDPRLYNITVKTDAYGSVEINKTAESGNNTGWEFRVFNDDIGYNQIKSTDSNGYVRFDGLPAGLPYGIEEMNVPSYYQDQSIQYTTVSPNATSSVHFNNIYKRGNLVVTKTAEDGFIENVKFNLRGTGDNGQSVDITSSTNGEGKVAFEGIPIGNYTLTEVDTGIQYIVPNATDIRINWGETIGASVDNKLKKGSVSGIKKGDDGKLLVGATIGLFKGNETNFNVLTAIQKTTTDTEGKFSFSNIPYGKYIVKELAPPTGYLIDNKAYPIEITTNEQIIDIEITDKLIRGNISIEKVDKENPENKLTDAKFALYSDINKNGTYEKEIDILFSNFNESSTVKGLYTISDVPFGQYLVKEIEAPEGYVLDENYYPVNIKENNKTYEITNDLDKTCLTNRPIRGDIEITKSDISDGKLIPNCGIRICDEKGNVVKEDRTDENGIVKFNLRYGKYTYQEFDAAEGYILDETPYPFEIREDGEIIKAEMTNELNKVTIKKTDVDGNALAGAVIGVYDINSEKVYEGTTDEEGIIELTGLKVGEYTYKELKSPSGYFVNKNVFTFSIDKYGIVKGNEDIINEKTVVTILKTDSKNNPLANAVIGVYDISGEKVYEGTTDNEGKITIVGLPIGTYSFKELTPPDGYILNGETYEFTIDEFGAVSGTTTIINEPVPKTSDTTPFIIILGAAVISAICIPMVVISRKKKIS